MMMMMTAAMDIHCHNHKRRENANKNYSHNENRYYNENDYHNDNRRENENHSHMIIILIQQSIPPYGNIGGRHRQYSEGANCAQSRAPLSYTIIYEVVLELQSKCD